jgi:hypothetical protein
LRYGSAIPRKTNIALLTSSVSLIEFSFAIRLRLHLCDGNFTNTRARQNPGTDGLEESLTRFSVASSMVSSSATVVSLGGMSNISPSPRESRCPLCFSASRTGDGSRANADQSQNISHTDGRLEQESANKQGIGPLFLRQKCGTVNSYGGPGRSHAAHYISLALLSERHQVQFVPFALAINCARVQRVFRQRAKVTRALPVLRTLRLVTLFDLYEARSCRGRRRDSYGNRAS